ncbi:hypothetical protein Goklo_019052 [Gossypium klotzschianum]|uniref:Asn/Gln amidotransferase domain-containing protein n=1 Tax=Gossypium klotzschianum TaxID=34286 RepID=A0A7J8UMQ7_9ROSI|nr:hypothetical protein [Gossypium klotzschianum]
MIDKVISENPKQLEQYRGGKTKLQGFFAGQWSYAGNETIKRQSKPWPVEQNPFGEIKWPKLIVS